MSHFAKRLFRKISGIPTAFGKKAGITAEFLNTNKIKRAGSPLLAYSEAKMPPTDLKSVITDYISKNKVMVFSKSTCPFCLKVKKLFDSIKVDYKALELDKEANGSKMQDTLAEMTGQKTVPNVYINGKHLADQCFNDDYVGKQPLALEDCCAQYWSNENCEKA